MKNIGLSVINHNTACSCACKYCFFKSSKKAHGVEYYRGKEITKKFIDWKLKNDINDFTLSYSISHCYDYPELIDNIEFNKYLGFIGYKYIQINGIAIKETNELEDYFLKTKAAGATNVDTTFYGMPLYHDKFASREGDFNYLLNILDMARKTGFSLQPTMLISEENKHELDDVVSLIKERTYPDIKIYGFVQDYRGNAEQLDNLRLTRQSYDDLPLQVKGTINIDSYKTEEEWLKDSNFKEATSRDLTLSLHEDNIDMIENMTCDEIIDYLVALDENFYSVIPDIYSLAKLYGDKDNQRLYKQRDLYWKWQKQYIKDNNINIHNVNDGRYCGSYRR